MKEEVEVDIQRRSEKNLEGYNQDFKPMAPLPQLKPPDFFNIKKEDQYKETHKAKKPKKKENKKIAWRGRKK